MTHEREGSDEVLYKGPCEDCGSDDNLVTYADGHRYCYSPGCGKKSDAEGFEENKAPLYPPRSAPGLLSASEGDFSDLTKRGLKEKTLRRFGYFRATMKSGDIVHVAPYYSQTGDLVCQKLRDRSKDFPVLKSENAPRLGECLLWGQQVWGDRFDRKVVITEGEIDAMSVAQAMDFKVAVVSLNGGADSATKGVKTNYRWLDRFDEIILWFDADEQGDEAVKAVAPLFQNGKVKVVRIEGYKDASDILQDGKSGDIFTAVWSAMAWKPEGIVNAAMCLDDMEEDDSELLAHFPFPVLDDMLQGMRIPSVCYHVAGTGVGKTTVLNEIVYPLIMGAHEKVGILRFEDTRRKTQLDLMSVHSGKRLHIEKVSKEEREKIHKEVFGEGLVELFDPATAEWSFEAIKSYIRYMVKGLDCKLVYVDPLSFIVAVMDIDNERRALDKASGELAMLSKELHASIHISHHLKRVEGSIHEEGGQTSIGHVRGSGGIANFANAVIGYERNQQGERPDLTRVRVLKNRDIGPTGIADTLKFDPNSGRLLPTNDAFVEGDNKNTNKGASGFPVEESY